MRPSAVLRAGLLILGVPQLAIGAWAVVSPHGWFDTFPGAGQHWLPLYGAYDSHLALDVGAGFLAIGVMMILAAAFLDRRLVQVALVSYLAYAIPHLIFHLGADHDLSSGAQAVNSSVLGLTVLSGVALLWFASRSWSTPT